MNEVYVNGKFVSQSVTGVQRYASELVRLLCGPGQQVHTIVPGRNLQQQVYQLPCLLETVGSKGGIWWEQYSLPAHLRKKRSPLLLNLCNMAPLWYGNKITCVHDVAFALYPKYYSKSFYYYYNTVVPLLLRSSRHILTVSEFSRSALLQQYRLKEDRVSVVPNAPSNRLLNSGPQQVLPRPVKEPFFLFVGSIDPRKNLLLLLKAFEQAQLNDIKLVVVGGGYKAFNASLAAQMESYRAHPQVHFTGAISDAELAACYRQALALVVPSVYEGFGLPLVEAMQLGCPVLASDIPVFREVGTEHLCYFNPSSSNELAALLRQTALQPPTFQQVEAARLYVTRRYSWQQSVRLLQQVLDRFR